MTLTDSADGLRVELLGPVEACVGRVPVALGGPQSRTVLAMLALAAGRVVLADRLIDELWGDDPPAQARASLQMHVSRLRKAIAAAGGDAGRLVARAGGYALEMDAGARDVDRWAAALDRVRRARSAGRLADARAAVDEGLAVWRGVALGGVTVRTWLEAERTRLEAERLSATVAGVELDLELGDHRELPAALEALATAHPFDERLVELLMLALYRCGRQADALAAFHAARVRLGEALGIEPGPPLRHRYEAILRHDGALRLPSPAPAEKPVLPAPPNRTIGREQEVARIAERLRTGAVRLLTLTGPGGVGKTRLALEVARSLAPEFADGAGYAPLASLARAEEVPAALARAFDVVVLTAESPAGALARVLAGRHCLLVVDNVEHVLAAAPVLGELLEACPHLAVLATSREPLRLRAEARHPVAPLPLADASALFVERARAHDPDIDRAGPDGAAVAEICRRLDGLPLAVELAAGRCGLLSIREIAERLDGALAALPLGARDAPARQRTLRAAIDWSHGLLADDERRCFARFAVFAGATSVDAAQDVTGAELDTLDRLVAKNLLVRGRDGSGAARLSMLKTLRAYAGERLAGLPDEPAVHERHHRLHLELVRREGTEPALCGAGADGHLRRLDAVIDDVHAALSWAAGRRDTVRTLELVAAIAPYWERRHRAADAVEWIDRALALPDATPIRRRSSACSASRSDACGRSDAGANGRPPCRPPRRSPGAWASRGCSLRRCGSAPATRSASSASIRRASPPTRRSSGLSWRTTRGRSLRRPAGARSRHAPSPSCASARTRPPGSSAGSATCTTSRCCSTTPLTVRCASGATAMRPTSPLVRPSSPAPWEARSST